jgi:MFS family permease
MITLSVAHPALVLFATRATDSWGRKPVILIGAIGVTLSMILFGTSKSYARMLAARAIGGLIGGTDTTTRVMASELASKESEAHIFSMLAVAYRIGEVVGQSVGGTLAHPEANFPAIFGTRFWTEYPYALPCFVGATYSLLCATMGQLILKETLQHKRIKKESSFECAETTPLLEEAGMRSPSVSMTSVLTWPFTSFLLSRALFVLIGDIMFAGYPLFAFTPIPLGGLGLFETTIGLHMSARAVVIIMSMFAYPHLERRLGRMCLYRCNLICVIPAILLFPVLHWIARAGGINGVLWNATLVVLFFTWAINGGAWSKSSSLLTI